METIQSPKGTLQESIARQRDALKATLAAPLSRLAVACSRVWGDRERLDAALSEGLQELPYCKFVYALGLDAIQISDNVSHECVIEKDFGRDRSQRPYMREAVPATDFLLSEAYVSMRVRRPSLTAIQIVRDEQGAALGFVGADFDLRDLPMTRQLYEEPIAWRQIKGDPAIRGTVFHQTRAESLMDQHIEDVIALMDELMTDHGVFHTKLHYSSSRATIWLVDDPYRYRLLDIDAVTDPDVCFAYPNRPYPEDAIVPPDQIRPILERMRELRFMDEMFYLRSSSLNIFNGMVSLTFSCDGSHYMRWDEFLLKDESFWVGATAA